MFKRTKDLTQAVEASPDVAGRDRLLGAQAPEKGTAQQAATRARTPPYAAQTQAPAAQHTTDANFDAIAGVSIELYAEISKGLAAYNYDINKGPEVAASKGVSAEHWSAAMTGWNLRIKTSRAVAQRFNAAYTGRA